MKQTQQSEEELKQRQEEARLEMEELAKKSKEESEQAKQKLKDTKKTFEGFSKNKQEEEMNLKDVFKNINIKDHLNEASSLFKNIKSSTSSRVGGILEKRKQLFQKTKKEEVEKAVKEELDKTQAEHMPKEEPKAEDSAEEAKEEKPKEPKIGYMTKIKTRIGSTTQSINQKAPFVYKTGVFFKDLWQETFPNDDGKVKNRMKRRKELAQLQQKYTDEELEAMQEEIPEWKRTAVAMVDESEQQDKEAGFVKRLFKRVGDKVTDSSVGQKVLTSEEYKEFMKKYKEVKRETAEFKEDFKDEVETTQNPVVGGIRGLSDKVLGESAQSQATAKMRLYDPEFDILELHVEVQEIFEDMFNNFLEGNLDYLKIF